MNTLLKNISISFKIYSIPVVSIILFSIIAFYAASVLSKGFEELEDSAANSTESIKKVDHLRLDLFSNHALLYRIVSTAASSHSENDYKEMISQHKKQTSMLKKELEKNAQLEDFEHYGQIKYLYSKYNKVINNTYEMLSDAALSSMFLRDAEKHFNDIKRLLAELTEFTSEKNKSHFSLAKKDIENDEKELLIMMIVVLAFSLISSILVATGITRPLHTISQAMHNLSQNNYDITLPYTDGRDEISKMSKAVDVFKEALQHSDMLTQEQQKEAAQKEENVRLISELVDSSRGLAEEVNTNVSTIAASVHEMSGSSEEIRQQTQRSTQMVDKAVDEGRLSEEAMQELSQGATRIGEVMQVINDIADKTNLLALNASIEAARAGEAGRGFAVVADEVKKLSTQTSEATQNIQEQIQGVQTSVTHVINSMQNIRDAVHGIEEVSSSISSAVEEQNTATHGISESMEQATQGVQGLSDNINQIYDTTSGE